MLVILDTTAIMNDPQCAGTAWRVLAHAPSAWRMRVLVPEVVIIEATAGQRRRIDGAQSALEAWGRKHAGPLGLRNVQQSAAESLSNAAASYRASLEAALAALNVEIVKTADIDHVTLVERAANRRRPCNSNGDGYRDTLNWLTIISLSSKYPDEDIVWVSDNTKDFGSEDDSGLHPDLMDELKDLGAQERVSWVRNLADLVLKLAADSEIDDTADIGTIQQRLQNETLSTYIRDEVLSKSIGMLLDPRGCALAPVTITANILDIGEASEAALTVRGVVGSGEAAIEFSMRVETAIQLRYPTGALDDSAPSTTVVDGAESIGQVIKPLIYSGLLTVDTYERPSGGELTGVSAADDDAGFLSWVIADMTSGFRGSSFDAASFLPNLSSAALPPDFYKNFATRFRPKRTQACSRSSRWTSTRTCSRSSRGTSTRTCSRRSQ
jgi:hypothetical protein